MGKSPTVSIIISSYNYGHLLDKTIGSILAQAYRDYEIILIDDGSTDDTDTVMERIRSDNPDVSITYQKIPNGGVANAQNIGVQKASGRYLMFMDADDWMDPDCLRILVDKALEEDADRVIGSFRFADNDGKELKKEIIAKVDDVSMWCYTYCHACLFRADLYRSSDIILESHMAADIEKVFKFNCSAKKVVSVEEMTYNYRIHVSETRDGNALYQRIVSRNPRYSLGSYMSSLKGYCGPRLHGEQYEAFEYGIIRTYYGKVLLSTQGHPYKEALDIYDTYRSDILEFFPDYLKNRLILGTFIGFSLSRKMAVPACGLMEKLHLFRLFLRIYTSITRRRRIVD